MADSISSIGNSMVIMEYRFNLMGSFVGRGCAYNLPRSSMICMLDIDDVKRSQIG